MVKLAIQWLKANSILLINASSLIGTTAITSGLGFIYWWMAARRFPLESIGLASAFVSAMMLLGGASVMGLGTLLITELPRQSGKEGSLISTALIVAGVVGTCLGFLFALFAGHLSPDFHHIQASMNDMLIFAFGVGLASVSLVLDQAMIGILQGGFQLWRNVFFAVIKLAMLFLVGFWPSSQEGVKIYATWVVSSVLSLGFVMIVVIAKKSWRSKNYLPEWRLLRKLGLAALQHHFLNLTLQAPTLILPVLVTILLSANMNAWFYVSWMIASFVFIVPGALTTVLHAMNSAQKSTLGRKARLTIGVAVAVSVLANCVLQLDTKQVLGLFGSSYATQAAWSLRVLGLAAFPLIIKNHYTSICRIQDHIIRAMKGMLPGGLLELGSAALGAHFGGLLGLSVGWVIAICIEAVFMFPMVYKTVRSVEPISIPITKEPPICQELWQRDTTPLQSIGNGYTGIEAIWLLKTSLLPVVMPTNSVGTDTKDDTRWRNRHRLRLKPPQLQSYHPSPNVSQQMKAQPTPEERCENSMIFEERTTHQ